VKNIPASSVLTVSQFFLVLFRNHGTAKLMQALSQWAETVSGQFPKEPNEINSRFRAMLTGLLHGCFEDNHSRQLRYQYLLSREFIKTPNIKLKMTIFLDELEQFFHKLENERTLYFKVMEFLETISQEELRNLTVETISDQFSLSRSHFSRKFQEEADISAHSAITNEKLKRAFDQLCEGTPVNEVAESLGFAKSEHFRDLFKKRYGMVPSLARKVEEKKVP